MVHGTHNALPDTRNEDILIYVNGELFPRNEAKISVFDSGYLVGDGIWEAMRLHHGVLVFQDEHLDRLWTAAATVGMDLKMTKAELMVKVWETLKANKMTDGVHVRFMVTRGIKKTPSQDPRLTISGPNLVIIACGHQIWSLSEPKRGCNSGVEWSLCMRQVAGSIPASSTFLRFASSYNKLVSSFLYLILS